MYALEFLAPSSRNVVLINPLRYYRTWAEVSSFVLAETRSSLNNLPVTIKVMLIDLLRNQITSFKTVLLKYLLVTLATILWIYGKIISLMDLFNWT